MLQGILKLIGTVAVIAVMGGSTAAQERPKAMTNQDVVTMLRAGKSEQIILTAMRTQPAKFDVSKQGRATFDGDCAAIKKPAGVSSGTWATEVKDIWDTMTNVVICQETNGRGGEDACGPATIPSKGNGRNEDESVTLERGVTHDNAFANWANSGQAATSPHKLPTLVPTRTSPQRDAAPPADAATKAETKLKLEAQIAAFRRAVSPSHVVVVKRAEIVAREIQALQRQKMFVEALRKQEGIAPLKAGGQLGTNSRTMAATQPSQTSGQTTPSSLLTGSGTLLLSGNGNASGSKTPVLSQTVAPAGSPSPGGGTLLLGGGSNPGNSKMLAPSQTVTPAGSPLNKMGGGTLVLGTSTNEADSKTVAPPTITAPVLPAMRQHPATPSSPIPIGVAAKSLTNVSLAAGSVSGNVFWNTSQVHYQLSNPCQGLQVTLSAISNSSLQKLASSTNLTNAFGNALAVWNYSGQGAQGPWAVCTYVFHQVPEREPLEVDATVTQPSAFSTPVVFTKPGPLQNNQFEISGGNCNTTPDSTLAVILNSGSVLCGDYAMNINFAGLNTRFSAAMRNANICLGTQIYMVNGVNGVQSASNPVVFTQDPAYNDYIITGCGFGTGEGGQVYLSGAVTGGRINMVVKPGSWTDTEIEAQVEPGLTGVLDGWPDLIVVPSGGGTPGKFPNCRFYAQRLSVLLPSIPQNYARLASETVGDGTHGDGTLYCAGPYPGLGQGRDLFPCISFNYGQPLDGITNNPSDRGEPSSVFVSNAVDRDGAQVRFDPGEDVYDLSSMAPGFVIDDFRVDWYTWSQSVCDDWRINGMKAGDTVNWSYQGDFDGPFQKGTKIVVDWPVDYCTSYWLGIFKDFEYYNSGYSLEVYVKGPIGVDPWTGQPAASH